MKNILLSLVGALALASTQAASFNCTKATTSIENLICGSVKLSKLDDALDKTYKEAQASSNPEEARRLFSDQKQWLKGIRNSCGDEQCLVRAYSSRIDAIKPAPGIATRPLTKIDTLESLAPVGRGYPEDIRQISGDLVYSHYDNSGNEKNIVDYDFTSGHWFNWVEGKRDPKLVAQDSRYIVSHTPHSASFPIEVIDRKTGASLSKIKLKTWVREAFIEGDRLVLFQASPAYSFQQAIAILELPSLKLIQETSIPGGTLISLQGNRIYTASSANSAIDLMVFDHQFKELGRMKLPPPIEKINANCQPQIVQNENDQAVLIANCGEMHVLDLKSFSVERSIPRYSLFYSVAIYKGLIFTTTDKQNGIVVFDMNSATEVARLPIPASYLFIKGNVLLAAEAPVNRLKDSSWPMQAYRINADLIRSGEWKNQAIIDACSQASQAIRNGGGIYEAVRLCGATDINGVINSGDVPADILPHAVNYAIWLSQTLHRYDESLVLFDKLHKYGASLGSEAIKEATLKKGVFGSVIDLKDLKTDSNSIFSNALRIGMSQERMQTLELPKLDSDLKFIGEYAYSNSWDCYPVAGQGVGIEVFDRATLKHLTRLFIRECDDEQQDTVDKIVDDKGKLFVLTGFRYPDKTRNNYYVFDKKHGKLSSLAFILGPAAISSFSLKMTLRRKIGRQSLTLCTANIRHPLMSAGRNTSFPRRNPTAALPR